MISGGALVLALAACGEGDDDNKSPPIGPGRNTLTAVGTDAPTSSADGTESMTNTDTDADTGTDGSGDSTGCDISTVLAGSFVNGGGMIDLPLQCRIRFYAPGDVEPSTGTETGAYKFQIGGTLGLVDEFPQAFTVTSEQVVDCKCGDTGYLAASCDLNGDGTFADGVGGYYPGLPMQLITLPATGVAIPIVEF
jgi:hypothetical protein